MSDKKIYHLNDKTLKYAAMAQSERLHQYLGLLENMKRCILKKSLFQIWIQEELMIIIQPKKDC